MVNCKRCNHSEEDHSFSRKLNVRLDCRFGLNHKIFHELCKCEEFI